MSSKHHKLIILGSGPAGYTAAVYAARANLNPVIITGLEQGGQLMTTTEVDNWPADADGVQGPELMARFLAHAERFGTEIVFDHIHTAQLQQRPFKLIGDAGEYTCDALIVATGASAKYLGLPSEETFAGRGVSACATCDGFFFKDHDIAVIGGGDSAMEEALFLTKFAKSVTIVHRREEFRASKIMLERAQSNDKIRFVTNATVARVLGEQSVTGLELRNTVTDELTELPVTAMFVAIGLDPRSELVRDVINTDDAGYVQVAQPSTRTNVPGVFAVGDLVDSTYQQAITAAGSGCRAAIDAEHYLAEH